MNEECAGYRQSVEKPALVVGANGYMGSQTTRQLVATGRKVRVLVRKNSNTASIDDLPVERCYGDVLDIGSLRAAMQGCGTVFYSVVDTRAWLTDPTPLYRCNVEGLRNAIEAATSCAIDRFVFTSSMATIGRKPGDTASEEDEFNWWERAPHYIRSRVEAENLLLGACREHNLPGIALCVANTYGPEDYQPTPHGGLLWQAAKGRGVALDCAAPTVDIRDAAAAALLAERFGATGERYIVANRFIGQVELYTMAASQLGRQAPRTIGLKMAYVMATISEWLAKLTGKKDVQLCRDSVFLSEVFGPLDNSKAIDDLGWEPRPIEDTVRDAIAWFGQRPKSAA
ncbi:NAD-dependent epimerase/dehydratase family protein [Parahaliea maris]|uniref:NAD-dependent epimerase/dehydratase family protein n=1 Tax=Parahaliea maris TaxID=2716870 RepID=A0A5C9A7S5_9GAMM|nr:NAD-dependent epimerase/dehydratase family protein [Parahaliea maris]TXS96169.1 NAD-dependent epimerase/dehydratase family protein [Parahaliea maris]